MRAILKSLAKRVFGDYELYRIYSLQLPAPGSASGDGAGIRPLQGAAETSASPDAELRGLSGYAGPEALGYGAFEGSDLGAACFIWYGERYRTRNFWPLKAQEAKLVQITTAERHRGKGLALRLLRHAAWDLERRGFRRAYARIWHSNRPSIRLFEKAGWREIALVTDIYPLGLRGRIRVRLARPGRK